MRKKLLAAILGIVIGAASVSGAAVAAPRPNLGEIKLWRALPVRDFVSLGERKSSRVRSAVFAFRSPGSRQPDRICIQIVSAYILSAGFLGAAPGHRECGSIDPEAPEPVAAAAAIPTTGRTLVAVATGSTVRRLGLKLESGRLLNRRAALLAEARARDAHSEQFMYAMFDIPAGACIESLFGEEASGERSFTTSRECR